MSNREKMLTSFHEWKALTNDQWILNTVQGYEIEFEAEPFQLKIPNQIRFSAEEEKLVDKEVSSLLSEGAIIACFHEPHEFISNIFLVPKPNGKFRPVINLKQLNEFVVYEHFKQETFPFVLELVQKNDFFTNLDLRSAYFSIPIHPDYQKFLKFTWKGMLYKFISLCFGLSSSPRVFTKVLKPVFALFRSLGIRCSYYIDDSINMHREKQVCEANARFMYNKLDSLGYVINDEKSVLIASQRIKYFGFILDSVLFMVFLPDEKVQKIEGMATYLLGAKVIKIRELASFIGLLINAFHAVLEAPLHYRTLEREKVRNLGISGDYNSKMVLSTEAKFQISWWADNIRSKNGKKIRPDPISEWIQTDASLLGWVSFWVGKSISSGGRWSVEQNGLHINYLELLAIFNTLKVWFSDSQNIHIAIQSDNTCAIACVNNQGSITSVDLDTLSLQIWNWCLCRNIYISAYFLPGSQNIEADFNSRNFSDTTEWMLKREIFLRLTAQLLQPEIDLFASMSNAQMGNYVSWSTDPGAVHINAFSMSWSGLTPYIFPPFKLLGRVLNKILEDEVEIGLLVCPFWPNQTWFPVFLSVLVSFPVRLPRHIDLLSLPCSGKPHPMGKRLNMIGALVSGRPSKIKDFQTMLLTRYSTVGDQGHESSTNRLGQGGHVGVISGVAVPFVRLKQL